MKKILIKKETYMSGKVIHLEGIGEVKVLRSARASRIRISVNATGEVKLTLPDDAPIASGEDFLHSRLDWLIKTREKMARKAVPPRQLIDGDLFTTRHYRYRISAGPLERPKIKFIEPEKTVLIQYPDHANPASEELRKKINSMIEALLRFEARQYLPVRTRQLASAMGFKINRVTIKNNSTNWGSCSSLGNINLNLHLMRFPDRIIDFIIIHELVHTLIPNHGPQFKTTMRKYFPDADQLDKEVRKLKPTVF